MRKIVGIDLCKSIGRVVRVPTRQIKESDLCRARQLRIFAPGSIVSTSAPGFRHVFGCGFIRVLLGQNASIELPDRTFVVLLVP